MGRIRKRRAGAVLAADARPRVLGSSLWESTPTSRRRAGATSRASHVARFGAAAPAHRPERPPSSWSTVTSRRTTSSSPPPPRRCTFLDFSSSTWRDAPRPVSPRGRGTLPYLRARARPARDHCDASERHLRPRRDPARRRARRGDHRGQHRGQPAARDRHPRRAGRETRQRDSISR